MKERIGSAVVFSGVFLMLFGAFQTASGAGEPMLAHMVFFQLKEPTDKARATLIEACKKHLSGHKGTVYFSAGVIAADMNREVNDKEFDVALHVVFKNRKCHDTYQTDPRHVEFVERFKESWKTVRVFDSYVVPLPRKARARPTADRRQERIALPDPAAKFAGLIRGEVVSKRRGGVVVVVKEVIKTWENNRASDAKALIGKRVLVVGYKKKDRDANTIDRFLRSLKKNEVVALDVAHKEGEALTLLELMEEQRHRIQKKRKEKKEK